MSGGGGPGRTGAFTNCGGDSTSINIADTGNGYIGSGAIASISGVYTNAKLTRFTLNNFFNDMKLSQKVSCVFETCSIPSIMNSASK